jgi:hypothetical protein
VSCAAITLALIAYGYFSGQLIYHTPW